MDLYKETINYVDNAFGGKKRHFERTVFWYEKFIPNLTEAHRIAAYAHDIERGLNGEKDRDYLNPEFLIMHQQEGAKIMRNFLIEKGADENTISLVEHLITKHEVGGDFEQDALMDADSVSFMETNVENFVLNRIKEDGLEKVKGKIDWMFNRIKSPAAKEIARPNYERWVKLLQQ